MRTTQGPNKKNVIDKVARKAFQGRGKGAIAVNM